MYALEFVFLGEDLGELEEKDPNEMQDIAPDSLLNGTQQYYFKLQRENVCKSDAFNNTSANQYVRRLIKHCY